MIEGDGMVRRQTQHAEHAQLAAGVQGSAEGDLPKQLGPHVIRAGEDEQPRAGRSAVQRVEQRVLVGPRRPRHVSAPARQRRGVEHDQVVGAGILPQEAEGVGLDQLGREIGRVGREVLARQRERGAGGLDGA